MKIEANYQTFAELAEYARQRALNSAKRNGHQEFAYWKGIMDWADGHARYKKDPLETFNVINHEFDNSRSVEDRCDWYARLVHLRKMLLNRGDKPGRLSLTWLREEAQKLEDV